MLLSTTLLCYLLHRSLPVSSVAQRVKPCFNEDPARLIWGCKIQLSNILVLLGKWTLRTKLQVIAQTLPIHNSTFTRHTSQHHAIIFLVLQSITYTLHLGYPSLVGLLYVTLHLQMVLVFFTDVLSL